MKLERVQAGDAIVSKDDLTNKAWNLTRMLNEISVVTHLMAGYNGNPVLNRTLHANEELVSYAGELLTHLIYDAYQVADGIHDRLAGWCGSSGATAETVDAGGRL